MQFDILSLFPDFFRSPLDTSMVKRARERGLVDVNLIDIRHFTENKHRRVDDRPYGGGPGMVMMPGPCVEAIRSVKKAKSRCIYLSPQGKPWNAKRAKELSEEEHVILLCGHYEGVDQRVIDQEVDEVVSIGDYVLTSGCLPALIILDSTIRFLPGVLGHEEAANRDSFQDESMLEGPQYTRPEEFEGMCVPDVLLGGNHKKIDEWQKEQSIKLTRQVRPELIGASNEPAD